MTYSIDDGTMENSELYKKQREERGWDDTETWNLDSTIAKFVYPRLKRFIELEPSHYPAQIVNSYEEWIEILNKMLYSFECIVKEDDLYLDKEGYEKLQEGLELFGKYYQSLWD